MAIDQDVYAVIRSFKCLYIVMIIKLLIAIITALGGSPIICQYEYTVHIMQVRWYDEHTVACDKKCSGLYLDSVIIQLCLTPSVRLNFM